MQNQRGGEREKSEEEVRRKEDAEMGVRMWGGERRREKAWWMGMRGRLTLKM